MKNARRTNTHTHTAVASLNLRIVTEFHKLLSVSVFWESYDQIFAQIFYDLLIHSNSFTDFFFVLLTQPMRMKDCVANERNGISTLFVSFDAFDKSEKNIVYIVSVN